MNTPQPRMYKGVLISSYTGPTAYGWRWEALHPTAGFLVATTLDDMKDVITYHHDEGGSHG